jgi:predicted acyl esterase
MRDGVQLATDVCRLDGARGAPVLLSRTPYDKERALAGSAFDTLRAVRAGYAVVIQDVRGRIADPPRCRGLALFEESRLCPT